MYFNNDRTCGEIVTFAGQRMCQGHCTYSLSGESLDVTQEVNGSPTSTTALNASVSGDTLTLDYGADAGGTKQLTRENSSGSTTCP
jgi:hypothetical protein